MKVKRFFESANSNLELLKDYTDNISDDFPLNIIEVGNETYCITINSRIKTEIHNTKDIDLYKNSISEREKIITKIKELLIRLSMDDFKIITDYSFVKIFIDFSTNNTNPINVKDHTLYISENKLKKIIKEKFGFQLNIINISEGRMDDDPIELYFEFRENIENDSGEKIAEYLSLIHESMDDYSTHYNNIIFTLHRIGEAIII